MRIKNLILLVSIVLLASLHGCGIALEETDSEVELETGSNTANFIEESIPTDTWTTIGEYFDSTIYPKVTDKFSTPIDEDGNGQVIILFYTMSLDGLGGYFWSGDFFPSIEGSNGMEILYINKAYFNAALETISHELEHLVNSSERLRVAIEVDGSFEQQSTWIDEGLAESAAHYVQDEVLSDHITNYNNGSLKNGNGLLRWDSVYSDYTQTYLFFQYLKNQSTDGDAIFKSIIEEHAIDYTAVETVVTPQNDGFSTFEDMVTSYSLANLARQSTGLYGYKDEMSLFALNLPDDPTSTSLLYSGAMVYKYPSDSDLENFTASGSGDHVKFYRVNQTGTESSKVSNITISGFSQNALVVVNENTDKDDGRESAGTLPDSNFPSGRILSQEDTLKFLKCGNFSAQELDQLVSTSGPSKSVQAPSQITFQTTTHTFNTYNFANDTNTVEITASLRYGTSTSNCLIYSAD
jgi:hypothetical protein